MLSKNLARFLISLQKKKIRDEEGMYVIEGDKMIKEFLLSGISLKMLVSKPEFINSLPAGLREQIEETVTVNYEELKHISTLKTPHNALALVRMPIIEMDPALITSGLSVALDCIQDPGNLGTIIRAAAWFGIGNIYCSADSVDVYNPKVIQASMGAIMHVNVFYTSLSDLLGKASAQNIKIYGTMMEGEPVYSSPLDDHGIILMGNESKGISAELISLVTDRIMIPGFSRAEYGIDSLNVGMAASVIFSEFARRRNL